MAEWHWPPLILQRCTALDMRMHRVVHPRMQRPLQTVVLYGPVAQLTNACMLCASAPKASLPLHSVSNNEV